MITLFNLSLIDIIDRIKLFDIKSRKSNIDISTDIFLRYIEDSTKEWTNGYYWLCGNIKLLPSEPITDDILIKLSNIFVDDKQYNTITNTAEYHSWIRSNNDFINICKICQLCEYILIQNKKNLQLSKLLHNRLSESIIYNLNKDILDTIFN